MIDVEVPATGTAVVQDGSVYEIDSDKTAYVMCTCKDGKHNEYARTHNVSPGQPPHVVGILTVQVVWAVDTHGA